MRAYHFQTQVDPEIFWYIGRARETWPVIDLPAQAGVENWRVLQGVGKPRLVLAEINPFCVGAVVADPKLNPEKPAASRGSDIHIDKAVAHFKVVQGRRSTIKQETLAALIFRYLGLSFQGPARRVCGNGERRWHLRMGCRL